MKKIILASLFMAGLTVAANAQKNSVLVYGTLGLNTSKSEPFGNKVTNFSLMPGIGYQFNNNWTAGLAGGIATYKNESGGSTNKQNAFAVGPFLRYTKNLSTTFFYFSQLDAQYASATQKPAFGGETKTTGFGIGVTPAIGINVHKGFALNFSFGGVNYTSQKTKGTSSKTSGFNISFGSQANIGISKNF